MHKNSLISTGTDNSPIWTQKGETIFDYTEEVNASQLTGNFFDNIPPISYAKVCISLWASGVVLRLYRRAYAAKDPVSINSVYILCGRTARATSGATPLLSRDS
jgi:hypothetical protein